LVRLAPNPSSSPVSGLSEAKKGKLLTTGRLDELVAEAERGYDPSKGVRERVIGRAALGGAKGASPRIAFRAQLETYEAALAEGRSESAVRPECLTQEAQELLLVIRR
jgi:hypothetical protein